MRWESVSASDRGLIRANNEDAVLEQPDAGVFAVADGMGGHAAGEIASSIAIESLRRSAGRDGVAGNVAAHLEDAIGEANAEIHRRGQAESDKRGMGTTLTVLRLAAERTGENVIVHIGDSRAYRLRNGRISQLTRDHTWVQDRIDAGMLTPEEAREHPYSSILTRVLGTDERVAADLVTIDAEPGDLFLLCSDGLSGMVADSDIERILMEDNSLQDKATGLVDAAKANGGFDNVTLVLVHTLPD